MARGKGGDRLNEVLTPAEKTALQDQKKELETTLKEVENYGKGTAAEQLDVAQIKKEIDYIDRTISSREPPRLSGTQKDSLAKEASALEERLREGLPTKEEMAHPAKNPGAVRKHMEWMKRNAGAVERYRNIQRTLNPYDPRSVEQLRREK